MRVSVSATAAVGSVLALVGFAGAANASATVDLIWIDVSATNAMGDPICLEPANRNCPPDPRSFDGGVTISSVAVTDNITLGVILTAGPNASLAAGVSVNYGDALPKLSVAGFRRLKTPPYFTLEFGEATDQPPYIDSLLAAAFPGAGMGIGLPAGRSAYLGTVTFHKDFAFAGSFEISVGTDGPGQTDDVLDINGNVITGTTTFNSAHLVNVSVEPPFCDFAIEVNALRAGGKTVHAGANQTVDVTAKARIVKGTAAPGTTIDTRLTVEAVDGADIIDTNSSEPITLGVGKGGTGDKLTLDVPQCNSGFIDFRATFSGLDDGGGVCEETRTLHKQCR